MKLVICEKPSVAKAVASALGVTSRANGCFEGNGYLVSWCVGHLVSPMDAAVSAGLFGPIGAGVLAALADFLGAILFPIGPYFPGFTFTQFCVGVVFGLLLQKKQSMGHIVGAVLLTQILSSLLLDSYWISVLYGSPYLVLLGTRAIQCAVMSALEIVVIPILLKQLVPRMKAIMA